MWHGLRLPGIWALRRKRAAARCSTAGSLAGEPEGLWAGAAPVVLGLLCRMHQLTLTVHCHRCSIGHITGRHPLFLRSTGLRCAGRRETGSGNGGPGADHRPSPWLTRYWKPSCQVGGVSRSTLDLIDQIGHIRVRPSGTHTRRRACRGDDGARGRPVQLPISSKNLVGGSSIATRLRYGRSRAARRCTTAAEESGTTGTMRKD